MRLFLSHTWNDDECGRNTHERVRAVRDALRARGMTTWFDEDCMIDNMDACMASGIETSNVFCVFLTRQYCRKVDDASRNSTVRDNCYKEFSYAQILCKHTLCVVFEPSMLSIRQWPYGIVKLYLGNKLYVDGSGDDVDAIADAIVRFVRRASLRERLRVRTIPTRIAPVHIPHTETVRDVAVGDGISCPSIPRFLSRSARVCPCTAYGRMDPSLHGGRAGNGPSGRPAAWFLHRLLFSNRTPVKVLKQNGHHDGVCDTGGCECARREDHARRVRILN